MKLITDILRITTIAVIAIVAVVIIIFENSTLKDQRKDGITE